jgi:hypothetical protein
VFLRTPEHVDGNVGVVHVYHVADEVMVPT